MSPRRRPVQEDPLRKLVQGILNLLLTTLATWLAGKITDRILGPSKERAPEESE